MKKLYEIFKLLWIQKRIVAAATIWGNTVHQVSENMYSVGCVSLCSKSEAMLAAMQPQLKSLKNVESLFYSIIFHGSMTA